MAVLTGSALMKAGSHGRLLWLALFTVAAFLLSGIDVVRAVRSSHGKIPEGTQKPRGSAFSLFNLRDTSKLWDNDLLLKTMQDMKREYHGHYQASGKEATARYTVAGDVAAFLSLSEIEAIYLPVSINFIFVGFDGSGNNGVKLEASDLQRWSEHMDHILRHTRVPRGDFQSGRDLQAETVASMMDEFRLPKKELRKQEGAHELPLLSSVHYNYSVHAVELGTVESQLFERAIRVLSRLDDPTHDGSVTEAVYQVDLDGMQRLMSGMIDSLLLDKAYNIFILNPKRHPNRLTYGYRKGLSTKEVEYIYSQEGRLEKLKRGGMEKLTDPWPIRHEKRPLYANRDKFAYQRASGRGTLDWVMQYTRVLDKLEERVNGSSGSPALSLPEVAFLKAQEVLAKETQAPRKNDRVGKGPLTEALGTNGGGHASWEQACLVNAWVSNERFAFIDLSATPCSWGPQVDGEGMVSNTSLPSVDRSFGHAAAELDKTDAELEKELERMAEERFDIFDEDAAHEVDLLLAEMDVYESFAEKHCRDRGRRIQLCKELLDRIKEMGEELEDHEQKLEDPEKKAVSKDALVRLRSWTALQNDMTTHEGAGNVSLSRDLFFAELSALLSRSMRHVFTPSTLEGVYHYWPKVNFQIYVVSFNEVASIKRTGFDVATFKQQILALQVKDQQFTFTTHLLAIADDPALGMAYASALRMGVVPTIDTKGTVRGSKRTYLDSQELEHQLSLLPDTSLKHVRVRRGELPALEVPVFVFAGKQQQVFIDKHHLAVSRNSMVIVVSSDEPSWRSHLQCNGWPIKWDLRNPMKFAVEAVAKHLAGVLPMHVTYSPAHETAAQDWLWAAGSHAMSATAFEHTVSQIQTDAVARSYVVTALDEAVQRMNHAISLLSKEITHEKTYRIFRKLPVQSLMNHFTLFLNNMQQVATKVQHFDFPEALSYLSTIEKTAWSFEYLAEHMVAQLHPAQCVRRRKFKFFFFPSVVVVGVSLFFILLFILRRGRSKPKIN